MERFHHPQSGATTTNNSDLKRGKKRGSYNCGRCGLPKKGHVCNLTPSTTNTATTSPPTTDSSNSARCSTIDPSSHVHLRRALSFDDADDLRSGFHSDFDDIDEAEPVFDYPDIDPDSSGCLPASCLWEILRRLPPAGILSAARVCKGWRETTKKIWRAAEVLRLRVPPKAQFGFVGSLLQKCSGLVTLSLRLESDLDSMMLACIAFSCPNLEALEITKSQSSINRITGGELGRFVADKRCLKSLKMEGCSSLGSFSLCSSSLGTLWLSDLCSLSKMAFNCPNLREISLEFSRHENDRTDLVAMVDGMVRGCPRLQNVHISSFRLSHAVVLALTAGQLRGLRMLSLVLGADITDASVASIASSYPNLELLDLSGSSISDSGIGMICNVFPDTLSRLLLALCPNITSSGIQFATAELPLLELMDCGMTICDPNSQDSTSEIGDHELSKPPNSKFHLIYQKLIIKHNHLKKLSLWGCSGLDALYLNCPQLDDLNLNSCKNLHPERLLLQCPRIMGLDLPHGGHLSHGFMTPKRRVSGTSIYFESMPYRLDETTGIVDYDMLEKTANLFRPKLIIAGASAYPRDFDYPRMRKIADAVGAFLMMDMAHISGLVAASVVADPFEYCDIVTTTTHKSLRGPRGGMIFFRKDPVLGVDLESAINNAVFPGLQGGPHNHTIGGLAVCLKHAQSPEFKDYQNKVVSNCRALASRLVELGYKLVSGGSDNHLVLVDLRPLGIDGARVEKILDMASITLNKNSVPGDKSALVPGGIRIGSPAMTTRGFTEKEFIAVADFIHEGVKITLDAKPLAPGSKLQEFLKFVATSDFPLIDRVSDLRSRVEALTTQFPIPGL